MINDDYVMHLIRRAQFVRRIVDYRQAGRLDEAMEEVERAWGELLDVPRELALGLDSPTLAGMLREPDRICAAARLSWEEGLIFEQRRNSLAATARCQRTLELLSEARALEPSQEEQVVVFELSPEVPAIELDPPRYRS
jgi:hypothetical protein